MWLGETGSLIINWSIPISLLVAIPVMLGIGLAMERGLIRHFYKRPHADQILVTFGLAIVLQEIIKAFYGANPIPQTAPDFFSGTVNLGALIGMVDLSNLAIGISYSRWVSSQPFFRSYNLRRLEWSRAGMADRETVQLLGINITKRFSTVFGIAAVVSARGLMYTPILPPDYHMGMDFLVLSFVVVVVGGMGSLPAQSRPVLARYFAVVGFDDRSEKISQVLTKSSST